MSDKSNDKDKKGSGKDSVTIETIPSGRDQVGGVLAMSEDVVATIAGLAARQIPGIHSLGRSRFISFGNDPRRGVGAEVGSKEAALDLEVIIEYGTNIREVSAELRRKIADEVDRMAGRKVVEVNIQVVGIHLPTDEPKKKPEPEPRVR